jgi:hypothetical protein
MSYAITATNSTGARSLKRDSAGTAMKKAVELPSMRVAVSCGSSANGLIEDSSWPRCVKTRMSATTVAGESRRERWRALCKELIASR